MPCPVMEAGKAKFEKYCCDIDSDTPIENPCETCTWEKSSERISRMYSDYEDSLVDEYILRKKEEPIMLSEADKYGPISAH